MASELARGLLGGGRSSHRSPACLKNAGTPGGTALKPAGGVQSLGSESRPGMLGMEGWRTVSPEKSEMV